MTYNNAKLVLFTKAYFTVLFKIQKNSNVEKCYNTLK